MREPIEVISMLSKVFQAFDSPDLISKLTSLRFLPQNGEHTIRLDVLLHIAASLNISSGIKIKSSKLKQLINSNLVKQSEFCSSEDPSPDAFCEEITFFGGGYRIFPENRIGLVYDLKHFVKALFLNQRSFLTEQFQNELKGCILFVLIISERLAQRMGVRRNTDIINTADIYIPQDSELQRNAQRVIFPYSEILEIATIANIDLGSIQFLIINLGEVDISNYSIDNGHLHVQPILKVKDYFIITTPSALIKSLLVELVKRIQAKGLQKELVKSYNGAVWTTIIQNLSWLKIMELNELPHRIHKELPLTSGVFQYDRDKLLVVALVTDTFKDIETDWVDINTESLSKDVNLLFDILYHGKMAPSEVMYLAIVSSFTRSIKINNTIPPYDSKHLFLTAESLEIISRLESGKNLFLSKYCTALEKLNDSAKVISFSPLSEYGMFRGQKYSFYFNDNKQPTLIWITDDFARSVRIEALKKLDIHSVKNPITNSITEVCLIESPDFPMYMPSYIPSDVQILFEKYCIPIWFINTDTKINGQIKHLTIEFAEMIGYWFNEFNADINSLLEPLSPFINSLIFFISIEESDSWTLPASASNYDSLDEILRMEFIPPDKIMINISSKANSLLYGETNDGERILISMIIKYLLELYRYFQIEDLFFNDLSLESVINLHMPLGKKKKLCLFDSSITLELDPKDTSDPRLLDEIDTNSLLDDIGAHVIEKEYEVGTGQKGQAQFVNKIVAFLWGRLHDELKKINGRELLPYLVFQNESLTRNRRLLEIQLPMRLEIANPSDVMNEFNRSFQKIIETSGACRFLIECAVCTNPNGLRPVSDELYDHLIAIASEIISWGLTSDLLANEVSDFSVSLLPSGRVGRSKDKYAIALDRFLGQVRHRQANTLSSVFGNFFTIKEANQAQKTDDPLIDEAAKAVEKEFGFNFSDLDLFTRVIIEISQQKDSTIVSMERDVLINKLSEKGISDGSISALLDNFSLVQRDDFFNYPGKIVKGKHDFYPWRYNRLISHVRRPLLSVKLNEKEIIIYGLRHFKIAIENFYALLHSGRMSTQVKSLEMQQLISKLTEPHGKVFNSKVADIFRLNNRFKVFTNVTSFGNVKLESSKGRTLGDIDVLVIDYRTFKIFLIECKNLLVARTPYELSLEIKKVFSGDDAHINKHLKRTRWIKEHLSDLLNFYDLDKKRRWKIKSFFVVDEPLFSSHIENVDEIEIITYDELKIKYRKQ